MGEVINGFSQFAAEKGLPIPDEAIVDGTLQRFHVDGERPGSKNGFYILHSDGVAAGCVGSWRTGEKFTWCSKSKSEMTTGELREFRARVKTQQKLRTAEREKAQGTAARKAVDIWKKANAASLQHPYLTVKQVNPFGLRQHDNSLIVPLRDYAGNIHSLQFIKSNGEKRFLPDGALKGNYFAVGNPSTLCMIPGNMTSWSCLA